MFSDAIELIEPENLIVEVLEDTIIDEELIKRLEELKGKGYKIALDDFTECYDDFPLIPLSNIIKYDLIKTSLNSIEAEIQRALMDKKILVAEKGEWETVRTLSKQVNMDEKQIRNYYMEALTYCDEIMDLIS